MNIFPETGLGKVGAADQSWTDRNKTVHRTPINPAPGDLVVKYKIKRETSS